MYYSAKPEEKKKMEFQFVGTDINDKFLLVQQGKKNYNLVIAN